jgi:hypothetical protein
METLNAWMCMKSKQRSFDAAARALEPGRGKRQNAGTSEAQANHGQRSFVGGAAWNCGLLPRARMKEK